MNYKIVRKKETPNIWEFWKDGKLYITIDETKETSTGSGLLTMYINFNKHPIEIDVASAIKAISEKRKSIINLDVEHFNKKVVITISDNGIGIPKDKLEQIFEPNFTTKNSGMGLGLTMVKKMIEEYKGEISVKSDEGKGTKFTIILPTNV